MSRPKPNVILEHTNKESFKLPLINIPINGTIRPILNISSKAATINRRTI